MTPARLQKLGLGYAIAGNLENSGVNTNSPSGRPGNIFADTTRHEGKRAGYFPDQQSWSKLPQADLWVGYWNDAKPGPGDLERPKQLRGIQLMLADGGAWNIPVVRSFDGEANEWRSELPSAWVCDENGNLVPGSTPKAIHAHLWDLTAPLADKLFAVASGESVEWPTDGEVGKAVVALLQTNYVIGAGEIAALELIGGEEAFAVVAGATRYDILYEWMTQKKTNPSTESGVSTSAGEAA
jgi:hypothetical protein